MKNKSQTQQKPKVLSIVANSRFQQSEPETTPVPARIGFTMGENLYCFLKGDYIVCRKEFDLSEIKPNSFVVVRQNNRNFVKIAHETNAEIIALVIEFHREVAK